MRKRNRADSNVIILIGVLWLLSTRFLFPQSASVSLESVHLKALQAQQQNKEQQKKYFFKNNFPISTAAWIKSQQQLPPKNYVNYSFLGLKNPWVGKKVESDDVRSVWRGSQKQIEKKVFLTTAFSNPAGTFTERAFETCSYPTKTFYPEGKAQGGLDHDFKKALQQKKSSEEVRAMLEKEF